MRSVTLACVTALAASGATASCGRDVDEGDPLCALVPCDDAGNPSVDAAVAGNPALPDDHDCDVGQKYAWFVIQEIPERIGRFGCAPDGTVALDGACMRGVAGPTTGYDDCVAGLACSEDACADICALDAIAGAPEGCTTGTCTVDPLLFANPGETPLFGVCR